MIPLRNDTDKLDCNIKHHIEECNKHLQEFQQVSCLSAGRSLLEVIVDTFVISGRTHILSGLVKLTRSCIVCCSLCGPSQANNHQHKRYNHNR